jgi:hypothetical protein
VKTKKRVVLRGWMAKPAGRRVPSDDIPQVFHLRGDALAIKGPGEDVVRVEIHELIK